MATVAVKIARSLYLRRRTNLKEGAQSAIEINLNINFKAQNRLNLKLKLTRTLFLTLTDTGGAVLSQHNLGTVGNLRTLADFTNGS